MGYIGSQPATNFETVRKQVSTTNSGTTITLDYSVSSVQDILVTVNAVVQSYDNYSVSGTTLTLGGTLNNDRVEILYVGRTFQTVSPAVGTVTNEMLSGSIANSKLANSSVSINGSSVSLGGSLTGIGEDNTPYFRAVGSGTQSVATATMTTIVFDSEQLDSDNGYNPSNYKYTIPSGKGGLWFFQTSVYSGTLSDGVQADLMIYKNSTEVGFSRMKMGGSINPSMITGLIANVAAGDALYARFNHYQGSNVTIQPNLDSAYFAGFRIKAI